jgi:hypothetical protein
MPLAQPGSAIKHPAVAGFDASSNLVEGNTVRVFLEAKGSAANIQEHLYLSTTQLRHENIKDFIRNWSGSGGLEALEPDLIIRSHKKPPVGQTHYLLD